MGVISILDDVANNKEKLNTMTRLEIVNSWHKELSYPNANYEQVIEGLNQIYKDFSNKHIPIVHLIGLVSKKIKGEISNGKFEEALQFLRKKHTKKY